jgi:TPP-dependent indolepyruvate ferredoxin oxidoreductase alpha subunit
MRAKHEYECVYGLGECSVLAVLSAALKEMEQRTKVLPAEPGAAAISQMVQPLMQMAASVNAQLPAFCPHCPKRIVEVERRLLEIRGK